MKRNFLRLTGVIFLVSLALSLSGCIDVLHLVQVDRSTLKVKFRMALSKQLMDMNKKKPKPGEQAKPSPVDEMGKEFSAYGKENKRYLSGYKSNKIASETDAGYTAEFSVKKSNTGKLSKNSKFALAPVFNSKNQMIFEFREDPSKPKVEPAKDGEKKQQGDQGMEKIVGSIMSSANYTIIVSGKAVKSAYIQALKGKKRQKVDIIRGGGYNIVRFPWITTFATLKQFKVVVQL